MGIGSSAAGAGDVRPRRGVFVSLDFQPGFLSRRGLLDLDGAFFVTRPHFRWKRIAAQQGVHGYHDVGVDRKTVTGLDLDQDIECWRGASLEDGLLGPAPARFLIRQGDGFDSADQVAQRRVEQQVVEGLAVGRSDQLDTALGDRARCQGFQFTPDLVDDDDLRVVILHGFDHHFMLQGGLGHLHAARLAHGRMRHIAVPADFIGRIHDHHALRLRQDAGGLTQERRLAHARAAKDQHGLARFDQVLDDIHRAVDGASHTQGETHHCAAPVANGRDAVQCALDAGAVIRVELTCALVHVVDFRAGDFRIPDLIS